MRLFCLMPMPLRVSVYWLSAVRRAELLYGSKIGVFQYNQLLTVSTKTADGVVRVPEYPCECLEAG